MNTSNQNTRILLVAGMMLLAAFSRLIPHWPNFTAIMAVALFGGAKLKNTSLAIVLPLAVMLITDLSYSSMQFGGTEVVIGFHSLMPLVYGCIALTSLIGIYVSRKRGAGYIIGGSLLASTLFFLITNAGVWFNNAQFAQNIQGLISCYTLGIPFYYNQLLGDLFFNGILFGTFALVTKKVLVPKAS